MTIKTKLILFFLLVKIIPLLIVFYISIIGVQSLNEYLKTHIIETSSTNSKILEETTNSALKDTIKYLDKKSQESLEKMTYQLAKEVADFLYERDKDILFLSTLKIDDSVLKNFYDSKYNYVIDTPKYFYDDATSSWKSNDEVKKAKRDKKTSNLKDNEKEFNVVDPYKTKYKKRALYKELSFFDLDGNEIYKYSKINPKKVNVFNKKNTYVNAEDYKNDIEVLKKGEIYVSNVIGEQLPARIIGTFTKEKAAKANIDFKPEEYGYAGKENPVGKKFEGIIRYIIPVFKDDKKVGYLSMALDHYHIMEFTDKINPVSNEVRQVIADATEGNYAFIWDNKGRNLSHARDYFISGFNKETGKREIPWLSYDVSKKYKESNKEINEFLEDYPKFENQSLNKKPEMSHLTKNERVGLDCRYLNFAPQCAGWMQLTENGGYGSFIIFWSNVWKLTTAATIPYYTGQYKDSKRGFGFVTIGANVDEFHAAANKTKDRIKAIINEQKEVLDINKEVNEKIVNNYLNDIINELSTFTIVMVIIVILIAIWMSNFISRKVENLLLGTKYFAQGDFDYQIDESSKNEIGQLEKSFNKMLTKIKKLMQEQKELNATLKKKIDKEVEDNLKKEHLLFEKSKLASMGEMIGNIAHQWRQPLSIISTSVSGIKVNLEFDMLEKEQIERCVDNVTNQTVYLSQTIDNFRNFIKEDKQYIDVSVKEIIEYVVSLMDASLSNNYINLVTQINTDARINANKNEIAEAFINLINNSKDALLSNLQKEEFKLILIKLNETNDGFIEIKLYDNGFGIKQSIINRIFEPYFTTKHKSLGTGLGLSMVNKIITERYKGEITITNENFEYEGKKYTGACFRIVFKISQK